MAQFADPNIDTNAQRIVLASGTATEPTVTWANDLTKGFYFDPVAGEVKASGFNGGGGGTNVLVGYQKPNLTWVSVTEVTLETGLNGTSGAAYIVFPDGTTRTDSNSTHIVFDDTRNAILSGSAQSGLDTGSVTDNTWYALYAVKVTDNLTDFVLAGTLNLPLQPNKSALDVAFGINGYVYLGMARVGDNNATSSDILTFKMTGRTYEFYNNSGTTVRGVQLRSGSGTYTNSRGTGATDIPDQLYIARYGGAGAASTDLSDSNSTEYHRHNGGGGTQTYYVFAPADINLSINGSGSVALTISGFEDPRV